MPPLADIKILPISYEGSPNGPGAPFCLNSSISVSLEHIILYGFSDMVLPDVMKNQVWPDAQMAFNVLKLMMYYLRLPINHANKAIILKVFEEGLNKDNFSSRRLTCVNSCLNNDNLLATTDIWVKNNFAQDDESVQAEKKFDKLFNAKELIHDPLVKRQVSIDYFVMLRVQMAKLKQNLVLFELACKCLKNGVFPAVFSSDPDEKTWGIGDFYKGDNLLGIAFVEATVLLLKEEDIQFENKIDEPMAYWDKVSDDVRYYHLYESLLRTKQTYLSLTAHSTFADSTWQECNINPQKLVVPVVIPPITDELAANVPPESLNVNEAQPKKLDPTPFDKYALSVKKTFRLFSPESRSINSTINRNLAKKIEHEISEGKNLQLILLPENLKYLHWQAINEHIGATPNKRFVYRGIRSSTLNHLIAFFRATLPQVEETLEIKKHRVVKALQAYTQRATVPIPGGFLIASHQRETSRGINIELAKSLYTSLEGIDNETDMKQMFSSENIKAKRSEKFQAAAGKSYDFGIRSDELSSVINLARDLFKDASEANLTPVAQAQT